YPGSDARGVAGRVREAGGFEAGAAQDAGVAAPAGGAVGGRVVAAVRQAEVDAQRRPQPDDLRLGQVDQRGADAEGAAPLDARPRRQVGQPLEDVDELLATIRIATKVNRVHADVNVEALQNLRPAEGEGEEHRVAGGDV